MARSSIARRSALAAALALLLGPMTAVAQNPVPQPTPQAEMPDSVREMLIELQTLQQELGVLQQQALESDTALQQKQETLEQAIEAAMVEVDPSVEQASDRLEALRGEAMAAEAAQDTAGIMKLMQEAQEIQTTLERAQQAAMERDDVAAAVESFRSDLMVAMKKVNPEAETMVQRFETLMERLEAATSPRG